MPDFKKMYFTMVKENNRAMEILVNAQRTCQAMYVNSDDFDDEEEEDEEEAEKE